MNTYTNRPNAISREKTYVLGEAGISDGTGEWAYEELTEIRLKYAPTRYYSGIYECHIRSARGSVVLCNREYRGPANFEYKNEAYTAFVKELHKRLLDYAQVSLLTGKPKGKFYFEVLASAIFFPLLLYAMFALGQLLVAGIALLVILIRLLPYFGKNRPRHYAASNVPDNMLP